MTFAQPLDHELQHVTPSEHAVLIGIPAFFFLVLAALLFLLWRSDRSDTTFFGPALAASDRALHALAARLGGAYQPGATTWKQYTWGRGRLWGDDDAIVGNGSHVLFRRGGLDFDVHSSFEKRRPEVVLAPRVRVTLGAGLHWRGSSLPQFDDRSPWGPSRGVPDGSELEWRRLCEQSSRA